MFDDKLIESVKHIARQAGEAILTLYHQADLNIQHKSDKTPVTVADLKANEVIEQGLKALQVQYPMLSEESEHTAFPERCQWQRYWLVDPLDGTQEFINGNGQFTVNIALMEKSEEGPSYPLLGVVQVPDEHTLYWGGRGLGAFKQIGDQPAVTITPRIFQPEKRVVALGSRSYGTERAAVFVKKLKALYPNLEIRPVGSALKSCHIAEGLADIYPRLGPTSEWDTGAAQAVLEGAGGLLLDPDGKRFSYNFKESLLNSDFLVVGDPTQNWSKIWNPQVLGSL
ncbi:3'(2'),5'-bisphosphate nucleotidase CysQ [Endozoicomonas sp. 4G]|uniref:3'(2'),5'-bisphosphate nucleotidase CysQ n=1 Tax=Endozoicomonas sp. 4G TaxID=2872754 RepID=UPI0020785960|nr:3'(2'),5'-bisphosphate nucleotidase CysQ [Endozoicomonas sp. 4G]